MGSVDEVRRPAKTDLKQKLLGVTQRTFQVWAPLCFILYTQSPQKSIGQEAKGDERKSWLPCFAHPAQKMAAIAVAGRFHFGNDGSHPLSEFMAAMIFRKRTFACVMDGCHDFAQDCANHGSHRIDT